MCSLIWLDKKPNLDADYREWLGPDWKPKFDGFGVQVSNHSSWMDIMALLYLEAPSFLAKDDVKRVFGVNRIAEMIESQFVERATTKEAKI